MIKCPICNFNSEFFVVKKDKLNQAYEYFICEKCGFLFEKDLFEDPKRLQEKISKVYQKNYAQIDYGWKNRGDKVSVKINKLLKVYRFFKFKKDISVLDYGAGNGYIASKVSKDFNVFCYDKYEKPVYEEKYKIIEKPIKTKAVYAVELVEHLTDIKEWGNILQFLPKIFIFTTELSDRIGKKDLADWWYLKPEVGHTCVYSLKSLYILAKKYGYIYLFFPSKSSHIFFKCKFLKNINFSKIEFPIYNFFRKIKHIIT